jgi:hypothetical protein
VLYYKTQFSVFERDPYLLSDSSNTPVFFTIFNEAFIFILPAGKKKAKYLTKITCINLIMPMDRLITVICKLQNNVLLKSVQGRLLQ